MNDVDLDVLEGRLDSMISKFRRVKLLRLQLQKQELEDTKKCRLCQVSFFSCLHATQTHSLSRIMTLRWCCCHVAITVYAGVVLPIW